MSEELGIAILQFAPERDRDANLKRIREGAEAAAKRGASMLVTPEYSSSFEAKLGPWMQEEAESFDGPFVAELREIAKASGLILISGFLELGPAGEKPYNTLVAVAPDGEVLAKSRKVHLYDAFGAGESEWLGPGEVDAEGSTFAYEGFNFGLQTCYDVRFPELSRALVDANADVLVVPAEWVRGPLKELHWTTLLRARAIENVAYVVGADQSPPVAVGRSVVIDPRGVDIAAVSGETGLAIAWLSLGELRQAREVNPSLSLRRMKVSAQ